MRPLQSDVCSTDVGLGGGLLISANEGCMDVCAILKRCGSEVLEACETIYDRRFVGEGTPDTEAELVMHQALF